MNINEKFHDVQWNFSSQMFTLYIVCLYVHIHWGLFEDFT